MANSHLVILKKPYLDAILAGRKDIESRFTKTRRGGFGKVSVGDKLFLKVISGPVCATATVLSVKFFENLTLTQVGKLKKQYNHQIIGTDKYWQNVLGCKYGFLAWLTDVTAIKPMRISKKDWRGWVVLTEKENFGLFKNQRGLSD